MLEKILNINPHDKFTNGSKIPIGNIYAVNKNEYDRQKNKDSALFSPLAKLMSKINWRIISVQYPSQDEILLHFAVEDIEFVTVINFNELYQNAHQDFSIYQAFMNNGRKLEYEVKLKVKKDNISILNSSDSIKIESISKLFSRIELKSESNIIQEHYNDELVFGLESGLNEELNYILRVIYTFISTKFSNKIKNNFFLKTQGNIPIILQKIAIINAE